MSKLNKAAVLDLIDEIGKVRCWLTGFHAGRAASGQNGLPSWDTIAGEDSLRQAQLLLKDLIR